MRGDILKGMLWPLVSVICQLFKDIYCLLEPRICSLLREWETTRRNVILKCVFRLLVPPIYSWICEGYTNEDRRYAFLFLALETASLILDQLGGSHWGYLLASCLLSFLILETTIYAYFISRSRIKSQDQQLIVQEIFFSVLQLIVACYCLIKTLSGAKTNYNSSLFPLASAIISVLFTLTNKNDVSHSSSDPPPNDPPDESVSIPMPTVDAKADPLDKSLDSVHKSDDKEDPLDKSFVYVPSTSASVPQTATLRRRGKQSHFQVDPLNPTLDSVPTSSSVVFNLRSQKDVSHSSVDTPPDSPSNQFVLVSAPTSDAEVDSWDEPLVFVPKSDAQVDPLDEPRVSVPTSDAQVDPLDESRVSVPTRDAQVDPLDEPRVSVPTSDAQFDPLDETRVSVPTSDAQVDPLDEPLVSVLSSDASIPQANTLGQRSKQSHRKVDPLNPTLDSAPTSSSVVFNLRSKKNVSHSSVDTPPDSPSNQFVLVSAPTSDAEVDPLDEPLVSVPTSDAQDDPLDEPLVSVPTSDAEVDPLDEPRVSVPTSDASIPQANTLRQCSEQSHFKKAVFKVNLSNDKAKKTAMKTISGISGVESIQVDMKEQKLTVIGDIDPVDVVSKLRKQCYTEIISVGRTKQPETREEKQSVKKKDLKEDPHPPLRAKYPIYYHGGREDPKDCVIC